MLKSHEKFHSANGKRQVLVVDDEAINRAMLGAILEEEYDIFYAVDGQDALEKIRANRDTLSLVLMDLRMPVMSGLELLRRMKADPDIGHIPVIVVTSDQDSEVESLTLGAIDFIPKPYPQPQVVLARVLRTIELSEDREIILSTERDPLTGLYNREYFYRYAEQFDQHHKDLAMDAIVVDVNHFHMINERFGTAYGDGVLRRIGERVREVVRDSGGIVCRREADTFMVYCPHGKDYKTILDNASIGLAGDDGADRRVRLRMGVYANADKALDIQRRFDRAKMAADTVRNSFTRTIGIYDSALHERELYAEQLIEDFHTAIQQRQFVVYYQPKFDVRPEIPVLASAEALVRWQHPTLGMISPGVFIPLFEDNGLIQALDNYVWRTAAAQIRDWKERLGFTVPVSVNVSRIDMYDPSLIDTLREILAENGLTSREILLEITESAYTQDSEQIIETVNRLRSIGFRIEMDDFGTGYSSLSMISTLPIDALKLDMQFIRSAFSQRKDTRMLEVILDIADNLSVPVIAEGVETEEQLNALKAMGCDLVQGYYFSRPAPAHEYERFVVERRDLHRDLPDIRKKTSHQLLDNQGGDVSFGRIAYALSRGFESIYYVDTENDCYVEFSSSGKYEDLQIERSGSNFFAACRANIRRVVFPDDQDRVAEALEKAALLSALEKHRSFSTDYRLVIDGAPVYYRLKVIPADADNRHIILGVSNIDSQITEDQRLAAERESTATYYRIVQALAADYFSIYYVDTETDRYTEYSSGDGFGSLGIENTGEDFFAESRKNIPRVVYPEDQAVLRGAMEKDVLMEVLGENGTFTLTYRLMIDGVPTYVHLKASRMGDQNDRHIVIGISDIDAQMRREQAQDRALRTAREIANRDALTGVKSKHAFVEAEGEWSTRIARGETGPMAVVFCDLNGLKAVNDTQGHKAGDQYIKDACMVICRTFQHSPVFRIGGDEFVAILTGQDFDARSELLARFTADNARRAAVGGPDIACGMAEYRPGEDASFEAVFDRADAMMYQEKKRLKSRR